MHHDVRLTTAPMNEEPIWPQGYESVLREAGAKELTIPYCVACRAGISPHIVAKMG